MLCLQQDHKRSPFGRGIEVYLKEGSYSSSREDNCETLEFFNPLADILIY